MSPEAEVQRSSRELLEQKRADFACEAVRNVRDHHKGRCEEYATLVKNLAASILQNGLGQTVAFLMSKAEGDASTAHGLLLERLATWLVRNEKAKEAKGGKTAKEGEGRDILPDPGSQISITERLMQALLSDQTTRQQWRRAEQEGVELAIWLKRFTEAFLTNGKPAREGTDGERTAES